MKTAWERLIFPWHITQNNGTIEIVIIVSILHNQSLMSWNLNIYSHYLETTAIATASLIKMTFHLILSIWGWNSSSRKMASQFPRANSTDTHDILVVNSTLSSLRFQNEVFIVVSCSSTAMIMRALPCVRMTIIYQFYICYEPYASHMGLFFKYNCSAHFGMGDCGSDHFGGELSLFGAHEFLNESIMCFSVLVHENIKPRTTSSVIALFNTAIIVGSFIIRNTSTIDCTRICR